jgi:signal transduction histidine kinase
LLEPDLTPEQRRNAESDPGLMTVKATQKRIGLRPELIKSPAPELLRDPLRLRQILVNLIVNAVKFTEGGEVVLRVAAEPPREGIVPLRLGVSDTGIGMPAAQRSLIFQHSPRRLRRPRASTAAPDWASRSAAGS